MADREMRDCLLMVFANKQDLPGCEWFLLDVCLSERVVCWSWRGRGQRRVRLGLVEYDAPLMPACWDSSFARADLSAASGLGSGRLTVGSLGSEASALLTFNRRDGIVKA